jgi:hypothetical protein
MRRRNALDREMAAILDRPVQSGHFGEYVAAAVFGIELNPAANAEGTDGTFTSGALSGNTVNVKYATKGYGLLNLSASDDVAAHPDLYLVLTGPRAAPATSRGTAAPWVIDAVYLFESRLLLTELADLGLRPGTARASDGRSGRRRWSSRRPATGGCT